MTRRNFFKSLATGLGVLAFYSADCVAAMASVANDIKAEYAADSRTLKIRVIHPVKNPKNHYIKRISVYEGVYLLDEKTFENQVDKEFQEGTISLRKDIKGKQMAIEAECSIFGVKKKKFVF